MRLTFSAIFLLTSFLTAAQSKKIEYAAGRLEIEVHEKWEPEEVDQELFLTQTNQPENFLIYSFYFGNATLDQIFETHVKFSYSNQFQGFQIIKEGQETINGNLYKWLVFNSINQGQQLQNIVYMTIHGDLYYVFVGTSSPPRMPNVIDEFWGIVRSVGFQKFDLKPVTFDENLKLLLNKKWILTSEKDDYGVYPVDEQYALYFELTNDLINHENKSFDDDCTVKYEYDNRNKEIRFLCNGRILTKKIISLHGDELIMDEVDHQGEKVIRTYLAM